MNSFVWAIISKKIFYTNPVYSSLVFALYTHMHVQCTLDTHAKIYYIYSRAYGAQQRYTNNEKKTIAKLAPAAIVSNNNTKKAMREAKERKNPNTSSF